jgi:hypothetical protein
MFVRMRLLDRIFTFSDSPGAQLDVGQPYADTLKADLTEFHFPSAHFTQEQFPAIVNHVYALASDTIRALVLTPMQAHAILGKNVCKSWDFVHKAVAHIRADLFKGADFPSNLQGEFETILHNPGTIWSVLPMADIARYFFQLGLRCEVSNIRDYPMIFAALAEAYQVTSQFLAKKRTADAISAANANRKPNRKSGRVLPLRDVDIAKALRPPSREEADAAAMSEFMLGCFHAFCCCQAAGALRIPAPQLFHDEEKTYEERFAALGMWAYAKYAAAFRYDDQPPDEIKELASRRPKAARDGFAQAPESDKTPGWRSLVQAVVKTAVSVSQCKPGTVVEIAWQGGFRASH